MAASTLGLSTISKKPAMAIARNQTKVIGAKKAETRAVPCDCTENSATRMTTVSGNT